MFLPHDVSTTRNAYHAMMASLMAYHKQDDMNLLVSTGLCCGYGKMDPVVSARQVREAYDDFENGLKPAEIEHQGDNTFVVTQDRNDEQPRNYDNREIHDLPQTLPKAQCNILVPSGNGTPTMPSYSRHFRAI